MRRAGLTAVSVHALRSPFASDLAIAVVDPATVRELVGHEDLKTAVPYVHGPSKKPSGQYDLRAL